MIIAFIYKTLRVFINITSLNMHRGESKGVLSVIEIGSR